jgi:ElaB/YqjD/DUF883 family membrane-anchored ribosome-binding protein
MATTNRNGSTEVSGASTSALRSNLSEAGTSLKQAAVDTGDALVNAAAAAGDELRVGKANIKADLADSALAGIAAAEVAGSAAREQVDELMEKGRDLVSSASEVIRERPLVSFGVAFATGWVLSKLTRGNR